MTLKEPYKTQLQASPNLWLKKLTELADEALGEGHGANWVHESPKNLDDYYDQCAWWINAYWGPDGPSSLDPDDAEYESIFV